MNFQEAFRWKRIQLDARNAKRRAKPLIPYRCTRHQVRRIANCRDCIRLTRLYFQVKRWETWAARMVLLSCVVGLAVITVLV